MDEISSIPEDRSLTIAEVSLIQWLLQHGIPDAMNYLPQLERARVTSRCRCGCTSINFAISGVIPAPGTGMGILADYEWQSKGGEMNGIFIFERSGLLAGLDVWSQDGRCTVVDLPEISQLRPIGEPGSATTY